MVDLKKARPLTSEMIEEVELLISTCKDAMSITINEFEDITEIIYNDHSFIMNKESFTREELSASILDYLLEKWRVIEEEALKSRKEMEGFFNDMERDISENCDRG